MKNDELTRILIENQKEYLSIQIELTKVLSEMKTSLEDLNDTNVLHIGKEDSRYQTIDKLATAVEARAKVMNTVFLLLALAIIVLAGAEKVLKFVP